MLTMDEYTVIDRILPNWIEQGDLIRVKGEIYEVMNMDIGSGGMFKLLTIDNYGEVKTITVPDDKFVTIVMNTNDID
jgi:hypothetical protein